jgi:hypothetical protein
MAVLSKFASKKELFKLEVLGAQLRNEYEKYILRAPRTLRSTCHRMCSRAKQQLSNKNATQSRNDGTQRYATERNCIERMRKYVIAWTFEFLSGARLLFLRYTNRNNIKPPKRIQGYARCAQIYADTHRYARYAQIRKSSLGTVGKVVWVRGEARGAAQHKHDNTTLHRRRNTKRHRTKRQRTM